MTALRRCDLLRDRRGSFTVELAFVLPFLVSIVIGTFEVGSIVAKQQELQSAASEGETIALATARGATVEIQQIENILERSVGLGPDAVTVSRFYRCDAEVSTVLNPDLCKKQSGSDQAATSSANGDKVLSSYIRITITDRYTPVWTQFGISQPINFRVERTVQLS